jgi:hypothetical protein
MIILNLRKKKISYLDQKKTEYLSAKKRYSFEAVLDHSIKVFSHKLSDGTHSSKKAIS